ncbi:MAG: hypothetical protein R2716_13160 [Microthrixaceae bacterium]
MDEPMSQPRRRPGRGFVVAGIALMALAVLGVVVVAALVGGSLDLDRLDRDVVTDGPARTDVPGSVGFRVLEDLGAAGSGMSVGVLVLPDRAEVRDAVECSVADSSGEEQDVRTGVASDSFVSPELDGRAAPLVVAVDLPPGSYEATCDTTGDTPGDIEAAVGRVVTAGEVFDFARPAFGLVAAIVLGGFLGLVGLILLVVGLVVGSRAQQQQQ